MSFPRSLIVAAASIALLGACTSDGDRIATKSSTPGFTPRRIGSPSPPATGAVFAYGSKGHIWLRSADSSRRVPVQGSIARHPALSPNGKEVVYEYLEGRTPSLALVTLATGRSCCFRDGSWPSFAPASIARRAGRSSNGLVARVLDRSSAGSSGHLRIAVGDPASEAEYPIPAATDGRPRTIDDVAWDLGGSGGPYIYYEGTSPDLRLYRLTIAIEKNGIIVPRGRPIDISPANARSGAVYVAPSSSEGAGSAVVLELCCSSRVHAYSHVELGALSLDGAEPRFTRRVSLDGLDLDTSDPSSLRVVYAGCIGVSKKSGVQVLGDGRLPSWLVGDGHDLYLVDITGGHHQIDAGTAFDGGFSSVVMPCR